MDAAVDGEKELAIQRNFREIPLLRMTLDDKMTMKMLMKDQYSNPSLTGLLERVKWLDLKVLPKNSLSLTYVMKWDVSGLSRSDNRSSKKKQYSNRYSDIVYTG